MAFELSELTLEEALRSYSSVKGHRTRMEREIGNLLRLLKYQYSATSEERINDRLLLLLLQKKPMLNPLRKLNRLKFI